MRPLASLAVGLNPSPGQSGPMAPAAPARPSRSARRPLAGLGLLAALLLALAAAPAQARYAYGSVVDKNDDDFTPVASVKASVLCFIDDDGDGNVGVSEPVYLAKRAACGKVAAKDLRLVDSFGLPAGSEVKGSTESDGGQPLTPVPAHAIRYAEPSANDGKLRKADAVYIDLNALAAKTVGVGDLRVGAWAGATATLPGGRKVVATDADLNTPLKDLTGCTCTVSTANMVVEMGKGTYLNLDRDAAGSMVEEGDVRLSAAVPSWTNDLGAAPLRFTLTAMQMPAALQPGAAFRVSGVVTNTDSVPGTPFLETRLDDELVDTRAAPLLMPTKTAAMVLTLVAPAEPGIHTLRIGDSAVAFNVLEPAEAVATPPANVTGTATPSPSASVAPAAASVGAPGPGLPVAVLGLAVVAGALLRRAA